MPGIRDIFGIILGMKHADKVREESHMMQVLRPAFHDYLTNPNTSVDDEHGQFLFDKLSKIMPKDVQQSFEQWVQQKKGAKALEAAKTPQQTPGPAGPGQTAGALNPGALGSIIGSVGQTPAAQPDTTPAQPQGAPVPGAIGFQQPAPSLPPPPVIPPIGAPEPTPQLAPVQAQSPGWRVPIEEEARKAGIKQSAISKAQRTEELESKKALHEWTSKQVEGILGGMTEEEQNQPFLPPVVGAKLASLGVNIPFFRGMASLTSPGNIPGLMPGSSIPEGSTDINGKPIDPAMQYKVQQDKVSKKITGYIPQATVNAFGYNDKGEQISTNRYARPGTKTGAVGGSMYNVRQEVTPTGQIKFMRPSDEGLGKPLEGVIDPRFVPVTKTGETIQEVYNRDIGQLEKRAVPVSSTTQRGGGSRSTISAGPSSTTPASATPARTGAPPTPAPSGRLVGPSATQGRREQENPYTGAAQTKITDTRGAIAAINKAMREMEKMGMNRSTSPGTTFLPRLAYAMGYSSEGDFLADMSMNSILEAGALLRTTGGQRSLEALKKSLVHTPDTWKDSGKLMYDKMKSIKARLSDVERITKEEGRKYPGIKIPSVEGAGGGDVEQRLLERYATPARP